jgi:hypothetical protein
MKLAFLSIIRRVRCFARRIARGSRPIFLAALAAALTGSMAPDRADARVNPLAVVESQIRKANMLIVLDTSGSMSGVPGGLFQSSSECGVDCDNGVNCRQAGVQGICGTAGRICVSDHDCRHGTCSRDNLTICSSDRDCTQHPGICSYTGGSCSASSPCPPQTGVCSATNVSCDDQHPCASVGACKYGNIPCTNPGGPCPDIGTCSTQSRVACQRDTDCPRAGSGGTCSRGGTLREGCSANSDCPTTMRCRQSGDDCRSDSDCPVYASTICDGGTRAGQFCHYDGDCSGGGHCLPPPGNPCTGTPNLCNLPTGTCHIHTDNRCAETMNTCSEPANTCIMPPANTCQLPPSATDTCVPSPQGTLGPIRMCAASQLVCARDSDCGDGDSCGPATSRAVIAKRAISKLVMNNRQLVNFGLMTFWQDGYYPYYQVPSGGSIETVTVFQDEQQLRRAGCYTWDRQTNTGGPSAACVVSGRPMTLRATADSRYRVRTGWHSWSQYDVDFCGDSCDMPNSLGWGNYQGSYYQTQRIAQVPTSTLLNRSSYDGRDITVNGSPYTYYKPLSDYYNAGRAPPIDVAHCGSTCSATCGGRWDEELAPFLDTSDDPSRALAAAHAITARMDRAADGGLLSYWGTPTGCTLENNGAQTPQTSAYHYMKAVKHGYASSNPPLTVPADRVPCRSNFVLLITDGAGNGPGDVDSQGNNICDDAPCAAANPVTAGCTCKSVLAAYHLKHDLDVTVFVVAFSGDVSTGPPATANHNVAKAGGSGSAFLAIREDQLQDALQMAVYAAMKGDYSSSAASTSAGTPQAIAVVAGKYALDSRMEFPSWKGHLYAYNVAGGKPVLAWDAASRLSAGPTNPSNWMNRRVYTWDGTSMVRVQVNSSTGAITNRAALAALGMGATPEEAEAVARWALGDPAAGNPAVLGAIVNSTPIDVASPDDVPLPGGHGFFLKHMSRPHLIYVGSSDMMLHAFFLEDTKVGTTAFAAGSEAFAFIPPDLLPGLRKLYSRGGQELNPSKHVFGLAGSPGVKSLCVSGCADDGTAVWKTLLIVPEGYGGNHIFALDITNPFGTDALRDPPFTVQWHTGYGTSANTYASVLGETVSLPAFLFNTTTSLNDYRLIFSSGHPVTDGSTTQGRTLVTASAGNGAAIATSSVSPGAPCAQEYAALTDVATARGFARDQNEKLIAAYFGDTAGQLWRYTLAGGLSLAYSFTCNQPLHFAPTVVQLDRGRVASSRTHEIYLVQVTNSNLDPGTARLPASQMIFTREIAHADSNGNFSRVVKDIGWGVGGQIALSTGTDKLCGKTHMADDGTVICDTPLPTNARPTSTPLGVLKSDGNGFHVLTMWNAPASGVCDQGRTYLTVHRVASNTVTQRLGTLVKSTNPAPSPVIIGGHVYVFGGATTFEDVTPFFPDSLGPGQGVKGTP